jgi:hypothetical protein
MMRKIPLQQTPAQKLRVKLDDQNCTMSIYYRFGATYMDLYVNNTLVEQGAICRNRASIIKVANSTFTGSLHFLDLLGDNDPDYRLFNSRYVLLFVPADETLPNGLRY